MSDGLAPGAMVANRFAIERIAGTGGMGTVFRARDALSGDFVALKVMHRTADSDAHRFLREAQVLAELKHPGIVGYVSHGHTEHGHPYLAMQWLDGEDLGQTLRRRGLRLSESLLLGKKIAEALSVAHRRGIVHRDLKPENLFLPGGEVEHVTLLDFGIARRALASPLAKPSEQTLGSVSARMTKTGVVIGTPAYMAPEQARGQKDASPASDVFSLGCVLFECLTGQPPFSGEHIAAVLAKILFDEAPRLRSLRKELPEALEALLMRMLAKQPEERPRDAHTLLAEFAALEALGPLEELAAPPPHIIVTVPGSIQGGEQQLFSVIYAAESAELVSVPTLDAAYQGARPPAPSRA